MRDEPTVFIVDDYAELRESLRQLVLSVGLRVRAYGSAAAFLDDFEPDASGCLVLDVRMPGVSGLELQAILREQQCEIPIIMCTGYGDIPMAVQALKDGAFDFVEKPFRGQELLDRIREAVKEDARASEARARRAEMKDRLARLTPREQNVVDLLVSGMTSKQIAAKLSVTTQAIDAHRGRAMRKLNVSGVATLAQLVLAAHPERSLGSDVV